MPKNRFRPAGIPWTHAQMPDEGEAFRAGRRAALAGEELPALIQEDRHAWRGVLSVGGVPAVMAGQWKDFRGISCWWMLPVEPSEELMGERIHDLATEASTLIAGVDRVIPVSTSIAKPVVPAIPFPWDL